jgi:hypothetical protein
LDTDRGGSGLSRNDLISICAPPAPARNSAAHSFASDSRPVLEEKTIQRVEPGLSAKQTQRRPTAPDLDVVAMRPEAEDAE